MNDYDFSMFTVLIAEDSAHRAADHRRLAVPKQRARRTHRRQSGAPWTKKHGGGYKNHVNVDLLATVLVRAIM